MTRKEVLALKEGDRVTDTRDNVGAAVLGVNAHVLRVRYDDSLSSNYIYTDGCQHLAKEVQSNVS